ncbi:DUF2474 family protein [Roseomonas sp. HJA6]|uniref:DUF2474 family protein n=1 Tax=Roseomonas alba TaxID=2846776 RepID=A0ABS7AAP5_9PROT|nr:DUF2474 family protein [Neoroseomonas alba]
MSDASRDRKPWLRRGGWFVLIWLVSVLALAVVAVVFRLLMNLTGMTV